MTISEASPTQETPSAATAERQAAAPAPDAALQAIEQQRQGTVVDTAVKTEQLAKELQEQNQPSAGEEPAPPTIPATPAEAKEPEFLDSVLKYYDSSIERGKGSVGATFDAILYALTSGSTKLWDWVTGLFNGKKKDEEGEVPTTPETTDESVAPATPNPVEAIPEGPKKTYLENIRSLLSEFGITETTDKKKNFFLVATKLGKEVEEKYGIPYQVVVAQSCLESGFGTSGLTQNALNCFGYKTGSRYEGEEVTMQTAEYRGGVRQMENAQFRSYVSLRESFMDYGKLLTGSSRYAGAFKYKNDPKRFLEEVIKAGYATDPNYVSKAEKAVATYDLTLSNAIA